MSDPDPTSLADQVKTLTDQVAILQAGQKKIAGDLNRNSEQLSDRINAINAIGKIIDMKVAFGVEGGPEGLVFTHGHHGESLDYIDSPTKTTHTGIISGDVIFMIAMVHGYNSAGGPGLARGRIIRTSSGGFDVFGTEDALLRDKIVGSVAAVVTFAGPDRSESIGDSVGGGTLMIAATADASGTYDCRVQITQRVPGFGAMQLQHMVSLVFRPAAQSTN